MYVCSYVYKHTSVVHVEVGAKDLYSKVTGNVLKYG